MSDVLASCACCGPSVAQDAAIDSYTMELDPDLERVRGVGFSLIYETGAPVPLVALAARSHLSVEEVESRISEVAAAGRARRDQIGNLV